MAQAALPRNRPAPLPETRQGLSIHSQEQRMQTFISAVKQFATDQEGVTAIEYGLIAALIAVAVAAGFGTLSTSLSTLLTSIGAQLTL
jgi:pilus assembly protein Flp/PilA